METDEPARESFTIDAAESDNEGAESGRGEVLDVVRDECVTRLRRDDGVSERGRGRRG